ncbi:MAG: hypothetical protein M1816_000252 [Peltula sp. TS41687]|nr:MAG: hypothetical protein M1816_000252 [Peltula sp. TS41687]
MTTADAHPVASPHVKAGLFDRVKVLWKQHVQVTVPFHECRDHLALERTFLSYLRTSLALSMTSVTVAQLFRLQAPALPRKRLGYYALGKPISGGLMAAAILVCLLGAYRFWRQQNAMLRGKVYAGGWEINTIGVSIAMWRFSASTASAAAQNESNGSTNSSEKKADTNETAKPNDKNEANLEKRVSSPIQQPDANLKQTDSRELSPPAVIDAVVEAGQDPSGVSEAKPLSQSVPRKLREEAQQLRHIEERLAKYAEKSASTSAPDEKDSQKPIKAGHQDSLSHGLDTGKGKEPEILGPEISKPEVSEPEISELSTKPSKRQKAKKSSQKSTKDTGRKKKEPTDSPDEPSDANSALLKQAADPPVTGEADDGQTKTLLKPVRSRPLAKKSKVRQVRKLKMRKIPSTVKQANDVLTKLMLGTKAGHAKIGGDIEELSAKNLSIEPVLVSEQPPVPSLSHGLDRALFNPGVYHLQDPRSKVFNFDPYLQKIMPVAEFDFSALKKYITSSEDRSLTSVAKSRGKRYAGSTSSMTASLAHFHYLLSQWRPVNATMISQGFTETLRSFTVLQRLPSAIFLRWRDGSYAIDADKEHDTANILSMLGKSMEKLLTLPTEDFERYRKSNPESVSEAERTIPEPYHYSELGDLLMRSQLDAFDARLPGTGMFDLKTRAVVAIRMDVSQFQKGTGYQIRGGLGDYESFEREYFDMIRAAFLKYSLQVRMGRMDGIFVAYHNIERIFGFQYVSLPEMDSAIHGTGNTNLGDQEFRLSLSMFNKVLDQATIKFPEQARETEHTLRIHFETRATKPPLMYIFAEPMTDKEADDIQTRNRDKIGEFERIILGLGSVEANEQHSKDTGFEERSSEEDAWKRIQAKVEEGIAQDELSIKSSRDLDTEELAQGVLQSKEANSETTAAGSQGVIGDDPDNTAGPKQQDATDKESLVTKLKRLFQGRGQEERSVQGEVSVGDSHTRSTGQLEPESSGSDDVAQDIAVADLKGTNGDNHANSVEIGYLDPSSFDKDLLENNANSSTQKGDEEKEVVQGEDAAESPRTLGAAEPELRVLQNNEVERDTSVAIPQDVDGNDFSHAVEAGHLNQQNRDQNDPEGQSAGTIHEGNEKEAIDIQEEDASKVDVADSETAEGKGIFDGAAKEEADTVDDAKGVTASEGHVDQSSLVQKKERRKKEVNVEAPAKDILAMTLTICNAVNGVYVERPKELTDKDNWSVRYYLSQILSRDRAWTLYQACLDRRRKGLTDDEKKQARAHPYLRRLHDLSRRGRAWRKKEDDLNAAKGEVVFDRSSSRGP